MNRSLLSTALLVLTAFTTNAIAADEKPQSPTTRPNVLVIIIDDVAANLHSVAGNGGPLKTPNLERLAARSTWFRHAYNDAPVCCGSRTALLTGVHAARSGVYYNNQAYRRGGTWIADVQNLPATFLKAGYLTAGYGKISHNSYQDDDANCYTPGYFKAFDHNFDVTHTELELMKHILPGSLREIPGPTSQNWTWGVLPDDWDRNDPRKKQQDTEQADRVATFLSDSHDQPFFLACGFWRPHVRWTVPQRYYDLFPLDKIEIPAGYRPGDLDDLPKPGKWIAAHRGEHQEVVQGDMWKKSIQSYLAAMTYVDEQLGRVLDALEKSKYNDNTIVIFFSDNGFHLGEKDHWLKYALWEQTCRVFFSVSIPGIKPQAVDSPVGLIDLYPTLLDLCNLPKPTHELDGIDLTSLLKGEAHSRGRPVMMTYGKGNHAVRDERYRYIRYRNGAEELYDHQNDPYEWKNLAGDPATQAIRDRLAAEMPKENADDIPAAREADGSMWTDEAFE